MSEYNVVSIKRRLQTKQEMKEAVKYFIKLEAKG